jgi:hypothetical protein
VNLGLHDIYYIRTKEGIYRGSEKHANMYAKGFVDRIHEDSLTRALDVVDSL